MAVNINDIETKMWSLNVAQFGEIMADIEDIIQSVAMLVLTVKGSVPCKPNYGCSLYDHIDQPASIGAPLMLREIRKAITEQEQRVTIKSAVFVTEQSSVLFKIELLPLNVRVTDPMSSIFIAFRADGSGVIYLVDAFGNKILTNLGYLTA